METFVMPDLHCPFPAAINPAVEVVQENNLAWARQFGLVRGDAASARFRKAKFGWLLARAYPLAGLNELQAIVDWNVFLFRFDDLCDEGELGRRPMEVQQRISHLLAILQERTLAAVDDPFASSLADIWRRIAAWATPAWKARFLPHVEEYFRACVWEAANRAANMTPTVQEYIVMRALSGGLETDFDLIDLSEGISLPDQVREHPLVRELARMASNAVCWSNDIFSLYKEQLHGDVHNLVLAIQHERSLSLQEAVDQAAALHNAEVSCFLALEQQLLWTGKESIDRDLRRYVGVLRAWMRGNLDWSQDTGRYYQHPEMGSKAVSVALSGNSAR